MASGAVLGPLQAEERASGYADQYMSRHHCGGIANHLIRESTDDHRIGPADSARREAERAVRLRAQRMRDSEADGQMIRPRNHPGPLNASTEIVEGHSDASRGQAARPKRRRLSGSKTMSSNDSIPSIGKHIGPTMELEPLLLDLAPGHTTASGNIYRNMGGTPFLFDQNASNAAESAEEDRVRRVERSVGPFGHHLMQLYKDVVQPSLPLIDVDCLTASQSTSRPNLDSTLLAAVYAVAEPWLPSDSGFSESSLLEQLAFSYLSDALAHPTFSAIQAGLLLMQRPNIDSKALNTRLIDAAFELGLQLDCSAWTISEDEKRLRRRLAWALYVQDKWCSLVHGRPSTISDSTWIVKPLDAADFDSASGAFPAGSEIAQRLAALTEILAAVLDTFYTPKAMNEVHAAGPHGTRLLLERAKPSQVRLKEWYTQLPARLKLDAPLASAATGAPASLGFLHLAYFATEITLHRCIIRSLHDAGSAATGHADQQLAHICRTAAKARLIAALECVNRLHAPHLAGCWYFPAPTAFALIAAFGALLHATAPAREEAEFYVERLREYRWALVSGSRHAPFLAAAVARVDDAEELMARLPVKPPVHEVVAAAATSASASAAAAAAATAEQIGVNGWEGGEDDEDDGDDDNEEDDDAEVTDDEDDDGDVDMGNGVSD